MKTRYLSIIIGVGITLAVISGMYVILLSPSPTTLTNPYVEDLAGSQNDQATNDTIKQIWNYQVDGQIKSVTASKDGSYVAAATRIQEMHADDNVQQGSVYLFDKNGNMMWQYQSTRKMNWVSISGNGQYVIASGYQIAPGPAGFYKNPAIYLFGINGTLLWEKEIAGQVSWSANISYDGSVISTSTPDNVLYLDRSGNPLWEIPYKQLGNSTGGSGSMVFMVSMTPDGSLLAVRTGADVFLLNGQGKILWKFPTQYVDGGGWALVSKNGKYVFASDAASGSEGNAYLLDASGNLLWKREVGGPSLSVGMSDDGSYVTLATNWQAFVFDSAGNNLVRENIPSSVAMSPDGSFVSAINSAPSGERITLLDKGGKVLSSYPLNGYGGSMSLSGDSRYLVTGTAFERQADNYVSFYEMPRLPIGNNHGGTEAPNYNESLHMAIIFPNGESKYTATVNPGQAVQIPWDLKLDKNYTTMNLQMSVASPENIESWISPIFPFTTINGIPPGDRMITIHPSSDTLHGNYTVQVSSKGDTVNQETGWLAQLDNKTLGTISVVVNTIPGTLSINVGQVSDEVQKFCVNNEHGGNFCTSGPIYQKVPITVTSNTSEEVSLGALNIGQGGWVKFLPQTLVAGPNGSSSTMMIAGYEIGALRNPYADKPLVIQASSKNDAVTAIIPVREGKISVLHAPSPIGLGAITTNSNGANFGLSGVVYDPTDSRNSQLQVSLSVLGLFEGNGTSPLPSWLSVNILSPSFILNATKPYYFMTEVATSGAPLSGTYYIAIGEKINGQDFVQPEEIKIENKYG